MFKEEWFKKSDYPKDYLPKGAEVLIGVDEGDEDFTIKGFYKDGEFHIQEVVKNDSI